MRIPLLLMALCTVARATPPAELVAALESFLPDPPRGWSFTQTTTAEGSSRVERHDASQPAFDRWSLVQQDGRAPTPAELQAYAEGRSRRSRAGTAPNLSEQFVLEAVEVVRETPDRTTYRAPLRPGESRDRTAPFLRATIVVHRPTQTVESVELSNLEPFSPTFGVRISELKTLMTYSHPASGRPSLPQKVSTRVRGRAFFFKSLDADMTVVYSDYANTGGPAR